MNKRKLDNLDKQLIQFLNEDGRMASKELAKKLNVSAPTVQSRMKSLIKEGILKIAGLVNPLKTKDISMAIIAIRIDDVSKMKSIIDQLMEFKHVHSVTAVTGQYDVFAEVIFTQDLEWMFHFYVNEMSKLDGVSHSESFMVTHTRRKWLLLPPNLENWTQPEEGAHS